MAEPYSLGPYKGELLLSMDGLFQVIRLTAPYPPRASLEQALIRQAVPVLVHWGTQVGLVSPDRVLWAEADEVWLKDLLPQLEQLDPLSAEERSEQVLLRKLVDNAGHKLDGFRSDLGVLLAHGEKALRRAQESRQYERVAALAHDLDRLVKAEQGAKELARLWSMVSGEKADRANKASAVVLGKSRSTQLTAKRPIGLATPQKNYRLPILRALAQLEGQGKTEEVLNRVYEQVKPLLKEGDMEKAYRTSDRKELVWRNRARWEIASLKEDGLVESGGFGVLVLTDKGREYLKEHRDSA